ncbi:RTA1 like protein-domain-containing protein [Xylariales sp. PMI_506]|nr:RTA1 like protein-domain-containing protein [Xylariales sp. PMI_506]
MLAIKSFYDYTPSKPVAVVACIIFAVNALYALFQVFRKRAWIWLVMVFAIAMDCFGFGARIKSAGDVENQGIYIAQFLLVILAPVFMAGIIYVIFGRIVYHVVPARARTTQLLWVPARWITPIFVIFDVIAILLQGSGAAIVAGTEPTDAHAKAKINRGRALALAGVSVQIAAFGLFTMVAVRFQRTSKQFVPELESTILRVEGEKTATLPGNPKKFNPNWRTILLVVNVSCALILIRSIYRVVEFAQGRNGYVEQYEWFMYVFDALPICLVSVLYNVFPPGSYLPHMGFRLPKQEQKVEEDAMAMDSIQPQLP